MQHELIRNRRAGNARSLFVFVAFAGIALFFLLSEHRIHAFAYLPLLLLLACPLLHVFHGHGGHGVHGSGSEQREGHEYHTPASPSDRAGPKAGETF